ncbi:5' nucleotidase, NT5C type [Caldisalinibacter kiritimatiensis]|uniref:Nucleotidase n=1 Tax=Caldisalinibacter kiritimatiensis TaxID=1304284 RepID=R1AUJ3_9FIRM|nr:hypothetical protein [Caldisalinibacter kiritimatiensis]EOD00317.1 HAD-superfamily hydrolase-like protein [Caldisalinibacter kiritimatiensis]
MKRLNICIDIDGTITNPYDWIGLANKYFNTSIEPYNVTEYEIDKVLGVTREEYLEFYDKFGEMIHLNATVRDNANEKLKELSKRHNLYYVTAREKRMTEVTYKWLRMNEFPMDSVFLLGSHYKVDKAKELNCDVFIEDRYENAIQLALAGFKVLLVDCYYNRLPVIPGITRVFNWNEIYNEIKKLEIRKEEAIQEIA